MKTTLYYAHDPMCSWCWAFEPVRKQLFAQLDPSIKVTRLLGGLAPDSDEPMPEEMQYFLQTTWRKIAKRIPGTEFNFDFWTKCQPKRSTYPANRAVIAARMQASEFDLIMSNAIQEAYYLQAQNPSDDEVLIALANANAIGIDEKQFRKDYLSVEVNNQLNEEIALTQKLGLTSFPSMLLQKGVSLIPITLDYHDFETMLKQTNQQVV